MVVHHSMLKSSAKKMAEIYRNKGYKCSIRKIKVGYAISSKRK